MASTSRFVEKRLEKTIVALVRNGEEKPSIFVSDSEVRRYILFYVKSYTFSREALEKLKKNKALCSDTHVQNAASLGKQKPWWLDGVPTLFDKSKSSLLKGSSCIEFIEKFKKPAELFRMVG